MKKKKILVVFGTRPEAIKLAPLILLIKRQKNVSLKVCITAQHREMLDQVLKFFSIKPDYDLNIMSKNQSINRVVSRISNKLDNILSKFMPDLVLVHGDTTTTFAASFSSFNLGIDIGHIEAGLRTGNILSPWPEEANRILTTVISKFHFAPTLKAKNNLLSEGVKKQNIIVTGNTVVDALFLTKDILKKNNKMLLNIQEKLHFIKKNRRIILITGHRRENFGSGFKSICKAIKQLANKNDDVDFVYPVHLNPGVRKYVFPILGNKKNIKLINPLDYPSFIYLMNKSFIILTDSGGIQEEAPSLGKPVLVMRNVTERPEAVIAGTVKLVGINEEKIIKEVQILLKDKMIYRKMSKAHNPYGNGNASRKILSFINKKYEQ